jgi:ketosteroid isomerase-like protein
MSGHVEICRFVAAPLDSVWQADNDPAVWAAAGHAVIDPEIAGDSIRFKVKTPPDAAGRSWSYSVERILDSDRKTVYSRRTGCDDFLYSCMWVGYFPVTGGTEIRCVVDFEMAPGATVDDDGMARRMEEGMRLNMTKLAGVVEQGRAGEGRGEARNLVDRAWAAIEAGEMDLLGELFSEDAELTTSAGRGRGREYVKQLFTRHRSGYPDLRHEVLDAIEAPDGAATALRIRFTARHLGNLRGPYGPIPPTGRQLVWQSSDHVRTRDGQIVSWHAHFDRLSVLEQLGQMPLRQQA